jgi:3,4-dihydroxy 2-butanone 4-phosphate synthase / GTP cyclohydrolase II
MKKLNTTQELIEDIRQGKMIILMDDEDRENEGDLVMAAECVTANHINFMVTHARGLVCLPISKQRASQLDLTLMADSNGAAFGTNFTNSIEASRGVTTGISAADRAQTIQSAVAKDAVPEDIVQPGHIFPIIAQAGGVLTRAGHTEASCDMARMAGFESAAVIVEILNEDGTMARRPDLEEFAQLHDIKIGTIADLIHYRVLNEKTVEVIKEGPVTTDYGQFYLKVFKDDIKGEMHFLLTLGDIDRDEPCLVRVHVNNTIRDALSIKNPRNISGWNINRSMAYIAKEGKGVIVVIAHEETAEDILYSSDVVLGNQQVKPVSNGNANVNLTVGLGSQLLREAGVGKIRLLGQNIKYPALSGFDLEVVEYITED